MMYYVTFNVLLFCFFSTLSPCSTLWTDQMVWKSKDFIANLAAESVNRFPSSIRVKVKSCQLESLHFTECTTGHCRIITVTLAGDTMHTMAPFLPQGRSSSLEDAVVLTRSLAWKTPIGPCGRGTKTMVEHLMSTCKSEGWEFWNCLCRHT